MSAVLLVERAPLLTPRRTGRGTNLHFYLDLPVILPGHNMVDFRGHDHFAGGVTVNILGLARLRDSEPYRHVVLFDFTARTAKSTYGVRLLILVDIGHRLCVHVGDCRCAAIVTLK